MRATILWAASLKASRRRRALWLGTRPARTAHRYRTASRRTYYARRHTFSLDAAASVTIDLADADTDAESLDTYLVLLARGDAGAVARLDADDDSGAAGGDSRLADSGLAAGGYTIVATSFGPGRTGDYTLSVDVAYDAEVQIDGLDSTARVGDVDVTDTFTVTPRGRHVHR